MKLGTLYAIPLLMLIIGEEGKDLMAEANDSHNVDNCHTTHEQVTDAPHQIEGGHSTEKDHHGTVHYPQQKEPTAVGGKELHVHLTIGVVSDDTAEGKHQYCQCHEDGAHRPHLVLEG